MAGNSISGMEGSVTASGTNVADVTKWDLDDSVKITELVTSGTNGRVKRYKGAADCTGTFEAVLDQDSPWLNLFVPGSNIVLELLHKSGKKYTIDAMIIRCKTGSDIKASSDPVQVTAEFGGSAINNNATPFVRPSF